MDRVLARLAERGFLEGPLAEAFRAVDRAVFVPDRFAMVRGLDVPMPILPTLPTPVGPSPRALALAFAALDARRGHRVLVVGPDTGYAAAVLATLVGREGRVTLAERDGALASVARANLASAGFPVEVVAGSASDARWERILFLHESPAPPAAAVASLAEGGALLAPQVVDGARRWMRVVREGGATAELFLEGLAPVPEPMGEPKPFLAGGAWDAGRLLALESALESAWTRKARTVEELALKRAVDGTWSPARSAEGAAKGTSTPGPTDGATADAWASARTCFHLAYVLQVAGDVEAAEDAYRASLEAAPSAEAWTFLGWALSFSGRFDEAIAACRRAHAVDPGFGNPMNDLGAYLIEVGRPREAIPWLERATRAERSTSRAFPWTNLGRARWALGDRAGARDALRRALAEDPDHAVARALLERLDAGGSQP
ncbi:MAG TPA: tetratricopeptide repeat protein [Candidatus Thermoplasmatota archaeon]|nr:tetratricopeptide repeat protein [Candidatus Thermoplasmatota archaeon]